jgi:hypothetical protein
MSEVVATVVRDVSPGLSGAEAALYGAIIAGAFTLLGVVVERVLRLVGFLRFEAYEWEKRFTGALNNRNEYPEVEPAQAAVLAERVDYRFAIDLFNGKEIPTGLRDIKVVLIREDGEPLTSQPYNLMSLRHEELTGRLAYDTVDVLNIPPRQFVHIEFRGSFDNREAVTALTSAKWQRMEFEAKRPKRPLLGVLGSKTYRKTITDPENEKRRGT